MVKRCFAFIQFLEHVQCWKLQGCFVSRILIIHPGLHALWKSSRSQNLVPYFYFSFSISKEKAVVNSNFPAGRGMGDFLVCERMAPPQPPEDSSSQEHLLAPIEASPNWVLGIRSLLFKCSTILQYLFPTCLMAVIAWECSSQGKLFLGPVMAEPRAANAHPESGLGPVAWELKMPLLFLPSLPGLAQLLKERQVNNFSSSYQYVAESSCIFHFLSLKSDFFSFLVFYIPSRIK